MGLIILGESKCRICGGVLNEGEDLTSFMPFTDNEKDPLFRFNDETVHTSCLKAHPLGQKLQDYYEYVYKKEHEEAFCVVCHKELTFMDQSRTFAFGDLYDAEKDLKLSFEACHESCLPKLENLEFVYNRLLQLQASGTWDGYGPRTTLEDLEKALKIKKGTCD